MSVSRRSFVRTLGIGGASLALLGRRAPEAMASAWRGMAPPDLPILLHNNENPMGPGDRVIGAMRRALGSGPLAGRYPFSDARTLTESIAAHYGLPAEQVMVGNGSTQLLRTATQVFTSPGKPLVAGTLTYEEAPGYAELVGHPVVKVPLDGMHLDLDGLASAAKGAGMVFLNNPNNPTATVHSADAVRGFIDRVLSADPDVVVMVDEAYHDYVTDPAYESEILRAPDYRRVVVARTFSKAHGMAGMRIGFVVGHPELLERMGRWHYGNSLNVLSLVGANESINDPERIERESQRNTEARSYTRDWFKQHGFDSTDSQCNFIFVEIGRSARQFREACREDGVWVGRDFPPFENSHARISIGTMEEMRYATEVFGRVLGVSQEAMAA